MRGTFSYGDYGVAIYTKKHVHILDSKNYVKPGVEIVHLTIKVCNIILNLLSIYKAPSTKLQIFLDLLRIPLHNLDTTQNIICIGDFNIDAQKKTHTFTALETFMAQHKMFLINYQPTTIYGSTLDHIWTTNLPNTLSFGVNNCYWSDHLVTYLLLHH